MAKYSCFNCPENVHDNTRKLEQKCPKCGNEYGFPLFYSPTNIGKYEIIEPIDRGFYAAVYHVKDKTLDKDYVLKVIPQITYKFHEKDFYQECKEHADLAKGSQHIVNIISADEGQVSFKNGQNIYCYFAVLEYLSGDTLKKILEDSKSINAIQIAQIAIDLFAILDVLRNKKKNHNDLHSGNIIVANLSNEERRINVLDDRTRTVAIDIGSLCSVNKSGDQPDRFGDIHWVANFLTKLSQKLIRNHENISELDYRLASLLDDKAKLLFPASENQRIPTNEEFVQSIINCFKQQAYPWQEPLQLINFNDTYNAQTLDPWFVPYLLVDPDDQWLSRISGKGPLIITGMRGCGKTMMLRALQFHALAVSTNHLFKSNIDKQIEKIKSDKYIGLYISCNKLLDEIGRSANKPLHQPFSKLLIGYGIEAIKAIRHLQSISNGLVKYDYYEDLVSLYKEFLPDNLILDNINSDLQLEHRLLEVIFSLNRGEVKYRITVNPANAFPMLANVIKNCSSIWSNHYVLFLLDDVSTRYLGEKNINNLLSSLLFQSEQCAFKITSEVQTIELVLNSPGKIEKAKKGRDFDSFDLGSAVNEKIRNKGGKKFVLDILNRRARNSLRHPKRDPIYLIGDISLKSIAQNIVTRGNDKTLRKKIYFGLSALAGVCVGDIGDIINLYDLIIRRYDEKAKSSIISPEIQNECFQDLCSIRLHEINRRGSDYKDFALSFAQAAHELLIKSSKDRCERLRQYYSIYVRITTGNTEQQYKKIRKLLDAGIFVFSGGTNTPRTLGNDSNPINQFKLTYRKLFGLSNLIGLVQGDRFELSGIDLEKWLNNPSLGKSILLKNVGGVSSNVDEGDEIDANIFEDINIESDKNQIELNFENEGKEGSNYYEKAEIKDLIDNKKPKCILLNYNVLETKKYDYLIAGLGFEDRTVQSLKKLLSLKPKMVYLIEYDILGKKNEILSMLRKSKINFKIIKFEDVKTSYDADYGNTICDVTGLSKSLIFNVVRNVLKINNHIDICHTKAAVYYPLNGEIEIALNKINDKDNYSKLEIITKSVMKGEKSPYEFYDLLFSDTDESKRNILIGFSNSKYERLFKIVESRHFDKINLVLPDDLSRRDFLGKLAAEIILNQHPNTELFTCNSNDLVKMILFLTTLYQKYYLDQNFNFEISITGSKAQTVAAAAISASFKISHCWYVKPAKWDFNRYSEGVGETSYFNLTL